MKRVVPGLLIVALAGGTQALGATSPVTPPAKDTSLGKKEASVTPDKSLAGDITRHKATKIEEQPTLKYDQFRMQVELSVASKRHEQIEYLQKIIALGSDDKEMPGLIFRLAELYWEESKYFFFESNRKDDEIFAAKDKKDDAAVQKATADKAEMVARSQDFQTKAISRYEEIVKKYPKFDRLDEVLYFLGHNLWESNKEQDALGIYKALITKFPKSKYIPDSWLAFGEFYFNGSQGKKDELSKALASYKHAAEFQDSTVYGFAIYKEAWCLYNLGDFKGALDLFKTVIFYGDFATAVNKDNKTALVKEARKDYVLTYSHIGDPLAGEDDFKKVGGNDNWMGMFKGLAGLYYDDGKDREAVLTYRRLIQIQPLSPDAPMFQARIVDAVMRIGRKQITLEQVRTLVKIIEEVKKAGTVKTDADKKTLAEAEDLAERTMSNLAVNWHNEAKKTRDDQTFVLANEVYSDYLEIFPDSKKSYDLRFFWAELLNDNLQKYEKAADQYSRVVAMDAKKLADNKKPGKWLTNASYDAILAYNEVSKKFEATETPPKVDPKVKAPIPDIKKKLLEACENYAKYVPKGDKVVEVSYMAAKDIYYRYNYLDEASKRFDDICQKHPTHELAEYSCNLVLDTKNLQGDLSGVYDSAKKYLANETLIKAHPKLEKDLRTVLEQISFKLVTELEGKGKYLAAARRYLGYVDEFPKGGLSDTALFNASVDFYKAHHYEDSIAARHRLAKEFPTSKFVPDAIYANAEAAADVGDFEPAAEFYEDYAHKFQKQSGLSGGLKEKPGKKPQHREVKASAGDQRFDEAKAQISLYNAGVFREGLGEYKQALADREMYLDMWPGSKDAETVFLSIPGLYEKQHAWNKAEAQYVEYEKKNNRDALKVMTGEARIAMLYDKAGNHKQADKVRAKLLATYEKFNSGMKKKVEGVALEQVARAHFDAGEPWFAEYDRVKLHFPPDYFKKALKEKTEKLTIVQKRYTDTVNFKAGGPAICALYKIGQSYAHFEDALKNVPLPKGLPQEQQDGIREGLEQQSEPLHAKASEAFQTAVAKSRELNVYNDCAEKSLALLSDTYAPDQFPRVTETVADVKGLPEQKQGDSVLTAVEPIPTASGDEEEGSAEPIAAPAPIPKDQPDSDKKKVVAESAPPPEKSANDNPPTSDDPPKADPPPPPAPTRASTPASAPPASKTDDEPTDVVQ